MVALIEEHWRLPLLLAPGDDGRQSGLGIVDPARRGNDGDAVAGEPDLGLALARGDRNGDVASSQRAHQAEIAHHAG